MQKNFSIKKPIYVNGRVIGIVSRDIFIKRVRASKHFLRTPQAICLDVNSLEQAEQAGAVRVRVEDVESGIKFLASIEHIRMAGFEIDRGYGRQIALTLDGWIKSGPGELLADQLSLWGDG